MTIQVMPVEGLPLIQKGDDIPALVCDRIGFQDGDILVLASTIYSKAKGYTRKLADIAPSEKAKKIAARDNEDPRFVQSVLDEAKDVLLEHPFILSELPFGHIGVRSGVDRSNIEDGMVILLPPDPMGGAREIRDRIRSLAGKDVGVIITDTCGRAFRRGQTGNAVGWAGFPAIRDYRNDTDLFGHTLLITEEAVVDEIAGFANFVMGESHQGIPAAVFRGCGRWTGHDDLYFRAAEDIIRKAIGTYVTGAAGKKK
ncbi:MAG TPA: coenzyme F420-0:L-glutamate ligase [Methanomicrobiales archaeon]|nr:coenzyme F420-0:L-glutamate ligase [Methanomicrobiales archaeon]